MQNKQCDLSIVDRIVVVVPRFSQWTGTRAMHEGDFSVGTNGRLPPKEVTKSLGLKAIIDTQQLRIFDRLKHKAEAILDGCGVRYLSGWAIPQDRADEVFKELDDLVGQYDEAKRDFLARYDSLVSDWAAKNPQFSREILEGKLDGASVAERIRAGYDTFRLRPVSKERAHELVQTVGGLAGELISSVSRQAKVFFKESFLGKTRANKKTVNAVIRIRERLQGLAFLSATILPVIRLIDEALSQTPSEGYFSGEPFWRLAALVKTLSDESLLVEMIREKTVEEDGQEQSAVSEAQDESLVQEPQEQMLISKAQEQTLDEKPEEKGQEAEASEPDLFAQLEEFFDDSKGQEKTGVAHSEEKTSVPQERAGTLAVDGVVNSEEEPASVEVLYPAIPEVDVGEGLYF